MKITQIVKNLIPKKSSRYEKQPLPWDWEYDGGIFIRDRETQECWIYYVLPTVPLLYQKQIVHDRQILHLNNIFRDISSHQGKTKMAEKRECHLLAITWNENVDLSNEQEELASFLRNEVYDNFPSPKKTVFLGVKARATGIKTTQSPDDEMPTVKSTLGALVTRISGVSKEIATEKWQKDIEDIKNTIIRNGGRKPTKQEIWALKSWVSNLKSDKNVIHSHYRDYIKIDIDGSTKDKFWIFSALSSMETEEYAQSNIAWALDAMACENPAGVVSCRFELENSIATKKRISRHRDKVEDAIYTSASVGEREKIEDDAQLLYVEEALEYYSAEGEGVGEPSIRNLSIVFGQEIFWDEKNKEFKHNSKTTFAHELQDSYGMIVIDMKYRHREAYFETKPCAPGKISNQNKQHTSLNFITASGITAFSEFGDKAGCNIGVSIPERKEVRIDTQAATSQNDTPCMLIAGQPGSGKTLTSLHIAHQAVLKGAQVIMINPKGADSLSYILNAVKGQHIIIGNESEIGSLDPYRWADKNTAVSLTSAFINSIMPDLTYEDERIVSACLQKNSLTATSMMDALNPLKNSHPAIWGNINITREASKIAALPMGNTSGNVLGIQDLERSTFESGGSLLLVEMGADIDLPDNVTKSGTSYLQAGQRYGLAATIMVLQTAMGLMLKSRQTATGERGQGGVLIIDEAWYLFASPEAKSFLERFSRLGRSLDMMIIFATQRVRDLMDSDLHEYLSRALILRLESESEHEAALKILGVEDDIDGSYTQIMKNSGTKRITDPDTGEEIIIPPIGWIKDLSRNVGQVSLQIPPHLIADFYSTNPDDSAIRRKKILGEEKSSIKTDIEEYIIEPSENIIKKENIEVTCPDCGWSGEIENS